MTVAVGTGVPVGIGKGVLVGSKVAVTCVGEHAVNRKNVIESAKMERMMPPLVVQLL